LILLFTPSVSKPSFKRHFLTYISVKYIWDLGRRLLHTVDA